jgi:hypothetical protein
MSEKKPKAKLTLRQALENALSVLRQMKHEHEVRPMIIDNAIRDAEKALEPERKTK